MNFAIWLRLISALVMASLLLASCGGGESPAEPTAPPPSATPFPTFAYVEPTKPPAFGETGAETSEDAVEVVELDPKLVERGRGRYEALECGGCHGENGEGGEGGPSLLGFALSEDDFITFVRSGGEMGPRHQFSTDRLSNSGSRNLYKYLVSVARRG